MKLRKLATSWVNTSALDSPDESIALPLSEAEEGWGTSEGGRLSSCMSRTVEEYIRRRNNVYIDVALCSAGVESRCMLSNAHHVVPVWPALGGMTIAPYRYLIAAELQR